MTQAHTDDAGVEQLEGHCRVPIFRHPSCSMALCGRGGFSKRRRRPLAAALPQAAAAAAQPVAAAAAAQPVAATSAVSAATPGPAAHLGDDLRPLWQVQGEFGAWIDYDVACNTFLEKSFQEGLECVQRTPGKTVVFTYFLSSFAQQSEQTKRRRVMRRVLIQSRMQVSLAEIAKHCEDHNKQHHTLQESHRRTGQSARSRSGSRARSVTRPSR